MSEERYKNNLISHILPRNINTLTIEEIKPFVDEFIEFAKKNPNLIFLVTEIGCGLAGLKPKEVAPLFKDAVDVFNIHLPSRFWHKCSNGA